MDLICQWSIEDNPAWFPKSHPVAQKRFGITSKPSAVKRDRIWQKDLRQKYLRKSIKLRMRYRVKDSFTALLRFYKHSEFERQQNRRLTALTIKIKESDLEDDVDHKGQTLATLKDYAATHYAHWIDPDQETI